jgi:response regulator RpfG family c-di-GMP phosphodiesterase
LINKRILLVDDDQDILSAYQRNLRKYFILKIASSGTEALEIMKESDPFAVVVSDYKMPRMTGIEFLSYVRKINPDTIRIMLTGYPDVDTAIEAVNQGNVFRFLTKPISTNSLITSIQDGIEQFRLINSERELLEKTLKGSIKILIDVLSMVNPQVFSQSTRYRNLCRRIAERLGITKLWEVEIAALLSQIGIVSIPAVIIEKKQKGEYLMPNEEKLFFSHPEYGHNLLKNIPRLEEVSEYIAFQNHVFKEPINSEIKNENEKIPIVSRILKAVIDYDNVMQTGVTSIVAFQRLAKDAFKYDPIVLSALEKEVTGNPTYKVIKPVSFRNLRIGMLLADDLRDDNGNILIRHGIEITDVILMRLINAAKVRNIVEPIRVFE